MVATNDSSGVHADTLIPTLPAPPTPSNDLLLAHNIKSPSPDDTADPDDIFKISPTTAMEHLTAALEALVRITGDIPPTPPAPSDIETKMRHLQAEKVKIVRSHSERSLTRLRDLAEKGGAIPGDGSGNTGGSTAAKMPQETKSGGGNTSDKENEDAEGITMKASSRSHPKLKPPPPAEQGSFFENATSAHATTKPFIVVDSNSQPLNTQHAVLTRKFYSKTPPPISITDYLARMHKYCPMSAAVYLATSLYIHRLAVEERAIAVTRRNVHRLVLAGLRVAMKALEDYRYKHVKMATVGGIRPIELARLEVGFCFLSGFELAVTEDVLKEHWRSLRLAKERGSWDQRPEGGKNGGGGGFKLTLARLKR
ncbi:hypothetical protein MKZ38_005047 [Zalerion maritima]|uniref:Uncharacterized protein n=1 Tax=Zalerion maritima TaxID=339359 RepID=A0AAD5RL68_9PEZI|nr:hypothetical protein MKZ38_005047 [Zalerion maritima]